MKKILVTFMIAIMTISMVGCGNKETSSSNSLDTQKKQDSASTKQNGAEEEIIELRVAWWGSEARHEATLEAIKVFEEQNSGIKILPEYQGWEGYSDKLLAQMAGSSAPDVFQTIAEWLPIHRASDSLLELNGKVDVSGQDQAVMEALTVDEKIYGVNISLNTWAYIVNETLLEKYGVDLPEVGYTWDDLADKFREIVEKSDGEVYGSVDSSVAFEVFPVFGFTKLGAMEPFPADNDQLTFTEEQVKAYYEYWAELREEGVVAPPDISVVSDNSSNSLVVKGVAAFVPDYTSGFGRLQSQTKDKLTMIPMPRGNNGEIGDIGRPGLAFSVYKNSEAKDAAIAFVDFMTNNEEAAKALKTSRGVLPTKVQRDVLMSTEGVLTDIDRKVFEVTGIAAEAGMRRFYPGPKGYSEVFGWTKLMEKIGQEIAFNKISIDEGVAKFIDEAQQIIETSK